jgi:hypothetical protein
MDEAAGPENWAVSKTVVRLRRTEGSNASPSASSHVIVEPREREVAALITREIRAVVEMLFVVRRIVEGHLGRILAT